MSDLNILIKPASGSCNMRCRYCFYSDEMQKRGLANYGLMRLETADTLIAKALDYSDGLCSFGFQGGEPTLRGLDFFRHFTQTVDRLKKPGKRVLYTLQTNGLALDGEWALFLKENGFLVGLSMDGDAASHDLNRVDASGKGTFNRVMKTARLLRKTGVPFNILTVVNANVARSIDSIYRFYKKNGLLYQQYIPCLDPLFEARGGRPWSLTPEAYGDFLIRLFRLWYADRQRGEFVYIHYFESLLGMLAGRLPPSCGMMGVCSAQNVVEADGSVYPCDFYALDEYRLGNVTEDRFDIFDLRRRPFLEQSQEGLAPCGTCPYGSICRGGCRRDRQYEHGLGTNFLCPAYKKFFSYTLPFLTKEAGLLRRGGPRAPGNGV